MLASGWGANGKQQKWIDTKRLLDYGFEKYKYEKVTEKGNYAGEASIIKAREKSIKGKYRDSLEICIKSDGSEKIEIKTQMKENIEAPIKNGDIIGKAEIYCGKEKLGETEIEAESDIQRHDFMASIIKIMRAYIGLITEE